MLLKLMEELDAESQSEAGGGGGNGNGSASPGSSGIEATMAGGVFLCSVPPSGNGPMTKRFIKEARHPISLSHLIWASLATSGKGRISEKRMYNIIVPCRRMRDV